MYKKYSTDNIIFYSTLLIVYFNCFYFLIYIYFKLYLLIFQLFFVVEWWLSLIDFDIFCKHRFQENCHKGKNSHHSPILLKLYRPIHTRPNSQFNPETSKPSPNLHLTPNQPYRIYQQLLIPISNHSIQSRLCNRTPPSKTRRTPQSCWWCTPNLRPSPSTKPDSSEYPGLLLPIILWPVSTPTKILSHEIPPAHPPHLPRVVNSHICSSTSSPSLFNGQRE